MVVFLKDDWDVNFLKKIVLAGKKTVKGVFSLHAENIGK